MECCLQRSNAHSTIAVSGATSVAHIVLDDFASSCSQAPAGTPCPMLAVSPGDGSSVVEGAPINEAGLPLLERRSSEGGSYSFLGNDGRNATNNVSSGYVERSVDCITTILPYKPHLEHGTVVSAASRKRAASSIPDNAGDQSRWSTKQPRPSHHLRKFCENFR